MVFTTFIASLFFILLFETSIGKLEDKSISTKFSFFNFNGLNMPGIANDEQRILMNNSFDFLSDITIFFESKFVEVIFKSIFYFFNFFEF